MRFVLIPLDDALPAIQSYLADRPHAPPCAGDNQAVAELLVRCVSTSEVLIAFALHLGGPPSPQ